MVFLQVRESGESEEGQIKTLTGQNNTQSKGIWSFSDLVATVVLLGPAPGSLLDLSLRVRSASSAPSKSQLSWEWQVGGPD